MRLLKPFLSTAKISKHCLKGALAGLRPFLANESLLKMMKNEYFILKALFVLKIFKFLS